MLTSTGAQLPERAPKQFPSAIVNCKLIFIFKPNTTWCAQKMFTINTVIRFSLMLCALQCMFGPRGQSTTLNVYSWHILNFSPLILKRCLRRGTLVAGWGRSLGLPSPKLGSAEALLFLQPVLFRSDAVNSPLESNERRDFMTFVT